MPLTVPSTNWARNVTFGAPRRHAPMAVDDLRALVAGSARMRALGSGHSFNRIADTTGDLVYLAGLPRITDLDTQAATVTVSAGMRYGDLAPYLDGKGYALANLASLPHIGVAGACATGTHGSGYAHGNLATAVSAIELVTADGELRTIRRDTDPDRLAGAVIGLGCLGIVTRLTLDVVPAFEIRQYVYEQLPDDQVDRHLGEILAGGYSVSVFTDLRTNRVWRKCLAGGPAAEPQWFGAHLADAPQNPVPGTPAANATQQLGVPGPWYERLPHFRLEFTPSVGHELQTEYLLPRRHGPAALAELRALGELIRPVLQVAEIRSVAADELWLSPSYREDSVGLHFTWVDDQEAVARVLRVVESRLAQFAPRPHWGKLFGIAPPAVRACYERMGDFVRLRAELDPNGKFANEFVDRYLGKIGSGDAPVSRP